MPLGITDTGGGTGASVLTYWYDTNDQLRTVSGTSHGSDYSAVYTYDANGNTKTVTVTSDDGNGDGTVSLTTYRWDLEARLVCAKVLDSSGATHHTDYVYDDEGNRALEATDDQTTLYLNDPSWAHNQVLEEYAPGGVLAATYVRGLDFLFQDREGTPSYYVRDGLGSTRSLTNAAGAVTDTATYDAFGSLISHIGTTTSSYAFAGERFDLRSQTYYLRARYYDPSTMRFTSRDSYNGDAARPQTLNHYAYALADPVNRNDPSGHDSIGLVNVLATAAIGGTLSAAMTGAYGHAKGWSEAQIAQASVLSFFVGAFAGAAYAGTAAAFFAAGAPAIQAWTAAGLIYSPSTFGLALRSAFHAFSNGDATDQVFATIGLGFAGLFYGTARYRAFALGVGPAAAGVRLGWAKGNPLAGEDRFMELAGQVPQEPGVFDLYHHSMSEGIYACEGEGEVVELLTLEMLLIKAGWKRGQPIRLFSCKAGDPKLGDRALGQKLADFLRVRVKAPTEDVVLDEGGKYTISNQDPAVRNTGTWRWMN